MVISKERVWGKQGNVDQSYKMNTFWKWDVHVHSS